MKAVAAPLIVFHGYIHVRHVHGSDRLYSEVTLIMEFMDLRMSASEVTLRYKYSGDRYLCNDQSRLLSMLKHVYRTRFSMKQHVFNGC